MIVVTEIVVFQAPGHNRSRIVCDAMLTGIQRCGDSVELRSSHLYRRPDARVAVFYGLAQGCRQIFAEYVAAGRKAVYIDLGYWGRRKRTRWDGFHKLSVNDRHPTAYFQRVPHADDRFCHFDIPIKPWRAKGDHIIIAGMSAKAAAAEGFRPEQWEREVIAKLRKLTRRPIIYRPKPNWNEARPIIGAEMICDPDLSRALDGCHAVVTHHSNVAVDAILAGVPAFVWKGVAMPMASSDLRRIEDPAMPDGREQWAADVAWTQWSVDEMNSGEAWRHLRGEGIVS